MDSDNGLVVAVFLLFCYCTRVARATTYCGERVGSSRGRQGAARLRTEGSRKQHSTNEVKVARERQESRRKGQRLRVVERAHSGHEWCRGSIRERC
jgi:hypothetical protein